MKQTNSLVTKPEFQASWITYAGAIAGVLQAFGEEYDVVDILGYSGYAFLCNVSRESTHIAAPTATEFFKDFDDGVSSLGYPIDGFWDEGAVFGKQGLNKDQIQRLNSMFKVIKQQLDLDNPVILWGLAAAEFGIVTGYEGEMLEVSTYRHHIYDMEDQPLHYTELDSPGGLWAYFFKRKERAPDESVDLEMLKRALKVSKGQRGSTEVGTPNEQWEIEQMDYLSGPEAYGRWASNLESKLFDQVGNSYWLALYSEGRRAAAILFERLVKKYPGREFTKNLEMLQLHYHEVATQLEHLHQLFPFPKGNSDDKAIQESVPVLRNLMHLESKSIALLEDAIEKWK